MGILSTVELSAQTYQERRDAILDKQNETRSEIEELSSRIREFEQQINDTENEYSKVFQQYEQLNKIIAPKTTKLKALKESKIRLEKK